MTACFDDFRAHGIEPTALAIPSDPFGRLGLLDVARNHDVVILQKKTSLHPLELKALRRANPRIVFDMDDAVMFHELEHGKALVGKNFLKFLRTVDHCAAVVAGNAFLARFAEANCPRVLVLPTPVDLCRYAMKDYETLDDGTITVGWIGVAGNLHYLKWLAPVFADLAAGFPKMQVKIVSNDFIELPGVRVINERWQIDREIESLRSFDIGVMPLADTLWARGKCGYKILQYMGVGVPAVASPVGINSEFIRHGETGLLAESLGDWSDSLRSLVASSSLRRKLGIAGRHRLENHYSQDRYVAEYAKLLLQIAG